MPSETIAASSRATARWVPVVILALGAFCAGTDNYLVAGVLFPMAHDLRMSVAGAGLFVTAYSLAYALGSPAVMTLVRVRSPRRLLLVSIALFVVVNVLAAAAWAPWVMAVARIAAGCVAGLYVPLAGAAAAGMVPADRRGRALAMIMGGISIATLAGVPLGVWITSLSSWRMAFVFVAAVAVVATIGVALSVPAGGATPAVSLRERVAPLRRPDVLLGLAVTVAGMTAGLMVYTYVGPIFAAAPAVGAGFVGLLIMAHGFGALIGLWRGSMLVDRFGARPVLLGCLTVFTVNLALQPLAARSLASAIVFVILWGVVGWAFLPAQQHSMIADAPPKLSPMLLSLNGSAMYLGAALGSAVGGAVIAGLGADHIWLFATAFAAVSVLLSLIRHRVTTFSSTRP
ncbi:MFS transporter [Amycolatopsis sp. GM8]|uniref:MFS transporter n=1 Tax=Amycolatopsis sp. GM8 TaxID=2896530 RepID=UPI001F1AC55D|nr:MFS transporter [Amycolatopsis sp. GM8]